MKIYLLDTHTLLWWFGNPAILSAEAKEIIAEPTNLILVSSVSSWEIIIKESLGKLKVPAKIFDLILSENFQELPVSIDHTKTLRKLPAIHQDPFDRLLIAQAIYEEAAILTRDKVFQRYQISVIEV